MTITPTAFIGQLTPAEQAGAAALGIAQPGALVWLLRLAAAQELQRDEVEPGVRFMQQAGVLSQARADELLATIGAPPGARLVVSSRLVKGHAQRDGRFWINEFHTLDDGEVVTATYLASPGMDVDAILAERAATINAGA